LVQLLAQLIQLLKTVLPRHIGHGAAEREAPVVPRLPLNAGSGADHAVHAA
jgi:hypothetical protein